MSPQALLVRLLLFLLIKGFELGLVLLNIDAFERPDRLLGCTGCGHIHGQM